MEFRLLGPLEVRADDEPLPIGGPKQRTLLALLLLQTNRVVTVERLTDALWQSEPPATARNTVQSYIRLLRKSLGAERIQHRSSGYVLLTNPDEVDLDRFQQLVEEAHLLATTDPSRAIHEFRKAVGLWRGPALDDLAGQPSLRPEIARLEGSRMQAIEERIGVELSLGRHAELVPELETLVHHNPYRERLWGQLMVALYRSGRQADALKAYRRARELLADELGIDPSPDLQRLQEQVLRQDEAMELRGEPLRGYRLLEIVGEGAFGVVHRATQPHLAREVAVKVIHHRFANDPDFIRRFESEAQLVARLENPRIVPLYDYWRDPDGAYLVMRFLRGGSLRQMLERGPIDPREALRILEQVAEALDAAHRSNVVHRDVKPENVLFDEGGNAYLSDFGIAKDLTAPGATQAGALLGTPAYISPEQVRGDPVTPAADIYSLGLLLYELLTAKQPFPAEYEAAQLWAQVEQPVPKVRELRPDLPTAIDEVIGKAASKDPEERFPDAPAMASAFRRALGVLPGRAVARVEARNPYKGLRAFLEADAGDFYGREGLTDRLVGAMSEPGSRFLAVVGPSGSGKSSLVRAGLIPALRRGEVRGSDRWFVVEMLPGAHPFEELEAALLRVSVNPPPGLLGQLENDEDGLVQAVERVLPPDDSELLLVVDQFEEVFTLVRDEARRSAFMGALAAAVADPRSRIRVVVTLRADFYDRPLAYRDFAELLAARTQVIPPPSTEELERAVSGPAEMVGATLEPLLVAEILTDVGDQPGALPLVEFALTELFDERTGSVLTAEAYHRIGRVSGAIAGRAEALYGDQDAAGREAVRQLFLRLVSVGEEGVEDTRRRVLRSELSSLEVDREAMEGVVDAFGVHRLLSFDRDPVTRGPTVEVAHEALLREWVRLRGWIEGAREDVRMHYRLDAAAVEWRRAGEDPSFLLAGSRLGQFEAWAGATDVALSELERRYLQSGTARQDTEAADEERRKTREAALERRSLRRARALVAVLAIASLIAASLTLIAANQRGNAQRASRLSTARELAQASTANIKVDPDRSLLLALQAVETTRRVDGSALPEAEEALHAALQAHRLLITLAGGGTVDWSPDGNRLATEDAGGLARVYDATTGKRLLTMQDAEGASQDCLRFSPDGRVVASASGVVWDSTTGEQSQHLPLGNVFCDVFTPDGRFVAAVAAAGGIGVWDRVTGRKVSQFDMFGAPAFSADGRRLLIADNYDPPKAGVTVAGHIADWRGDAGGSHLLTLTGHRNGDTRDAAWSPDGSIVATSAFHEVLAWNPETAERLFTMTAEADFISMAVSRDSTRIATGMKDGTAIVWDLSPDGARPALTVAGHDNEVGDVAFSPDGRRLATASADGTVKVWDVTPEGGREWIAVPGAQGTAFSPDGRLLATSTTTEEPGLSSTGPAAVHVWDADDGRPVATFRGHEDQIISLDFDPSGTRVASASLDGTARIWDVAKRAPALTIHESVPGDPHATAAVVAVAFSPDGSTLATSTSEEGTIRTWDATTGSRLISFEDHKGRPVLGDHLIGFSPDGMYLAGVANENVDDAGFDHVYVWSTGSGKLVARVPATAFAFSPDGVLLYTTNLDGSLGRWDTRTWHEQRSVAGAGGGGLIAVSPDGDRLVTLAEGTLRLWGAPSLEQGIVVADIPATQFAGPDALAFAPDGKRVALGTPVTVGIYALDIEDLIRLARQRLTRSWTRDECRTYLHLEACPRGVP